MKIMNVTNLDVDWFGASVSPAQKRNKKKMAIPCGHVHRRGIGITLDQALGGLGGALPIISDAKGEEIGHNHLNNKMASALASDYSNVKHGNHRVQ